MKKSSIVWEGVALVLIIVSLTPLALSMFNDYFIENDQDEIIVRLNIFEAGGFDPEEITVKKGQLVKLLLIGTDVAHGFAIESLYLDAGIIHAGDQVVLEFTPTEVGEFEFKCTMLCSAFHSNMKGKIIVED